MISVFRDSGFKRTLCGSKWDTLTGADNAFKNLGTGSTISTARYGCCPANKYMSSPEGTGTFVEADSCSACPAGTKVSLATFVPNDEISCFYDKMPDGCKGIVWNDRSCVSRKAVDDIIAGGSKKDDVVATYGLIENWDMSQVTDMSQGPYLAATNNVGYCSYEPGPYCVLVASDNVAHVVYIRHGPFWEASNNVGHFADMSQGLYSGVSSNLAHIAYMSQGP